MLISDYIGTPKPRTPATDPQTTVSLQRVFDSWMVRAPLAALANGLN